MKFETKHLKRLKELYPKAKHFVYIGLPENKEVAFTVDKGASLKKGIKDQVAHLKREHGYLDSDLKVDTYSLKGIKDDRQT